MLKKATGGQPQHQTKKSQKYQNLKHVEVKLNTLPLQADPTLKVLWVDTMGVLLRTDIDVISLHFASAAGDKMLDACRLQTSKEHAKRMVDALAQVLNHYPAKPNT